MVPKDWVPTELGEIATFKSGGTPSKKEARYWGGKYPWVSARDLKAHYVSNSTHTLTEAGLAVANEAPAGASLILVRGMTLHKDLPVGFATRKLAFNQDIKALIPGPGVDPLFLSYLLVASKERIRRLVSTAGHGTGKLDTEQLKSFPVTLPTPSEQTRIATIVARWDRGIELTEGLIIRSAGLKTALMQQLLTGRVRPPGFEDRWATIRFRDVFNRVTRKNDISNENVLTISAQHGLVSQQDFFNKTFASDNLKNYILLEKGDFAYNKSYSSGYPFGAIKPLERYGQGVVSSLYICFRLRDSSQNHHDFFRHFFEAGCFNREIYAIAQEGARNHGLLNVSVTDFFNANFTVPGYAEQEAIADIIGAAENEVENLANQLALLKKQKKALMQQLLTGKRRVKLEDAA